MLSTYGIRIDGASPEPGMHTFLVRNAATETHAFVILRVLPGHTVAQALTWFASVYRQRSQARTHHPDLPA